MKRNDDDWRIFKERLARCRPEDFDGHTDFRKLTYEQRLEWLAQAAQFVREYKGKARAAGGGKECGSSGSG